MSEVEKYILKAIDSAFRKWYNRYCKVGFGALSEEGTGSCPFYEKRFSLAVSAPHSVAAKKRMDLLWVFAVSDLLRNK